MGNLSMGWGGCLAHGTAGLGSLPLGLSHLLCSTPRGFLATLLNAAWRARWENPPCSYLCLAKSQLLGKVGVVVVVVTVVAMGELGQEKEGEEYSRMYVQSPTFSVRVALPKSCPSSQLEQMSSGPHSQSRDNSSRPLLRLTYFGKSFLAGHKTHETRDTSSWRVNFTDFI